MCMFCAAIPVAASTGVALNNKQVKVEKESREAGLEPPAKKPIARITTGVIVLLLIGSITYHSLTYLP